MTFAEMREKFGVPVRRGARVEYTSRGSTYQGRVLDTHGDKYITCEIDGLRGPQVFHPASGTLCYIDDNPGASPEERAMGEHKHSGSSCTVAHYVNGEPAGACVICTCGTHVRPADWARHTNQGDPMTDPTVTPAPDTHGVTPKET